MSSLIVEVCKVQSVEPHPNADRMALAQIKGWTTCIRRDPDTNTSQFMPGDLCVYFPPDTVLPVELATRLGVKQYLGQLPKDANGLRPTGGRVRVANLRGVKSFGLIMAPDDPTWIEGTDVVAHYYLSKYEPPSRSHQGDAEQSDPGFHKYFDMENLRNFPDALIEGEEVVYTEKIHGENCRLGLIRETGTDGQTLWRWMAGSHGVRRKRFYQKKDSEGNLAGEPIESNYWQCFSDSTRKLLAHLSGSGLTPEEIDAAPLANSGHSVVLFGERFGNGVQDMAYGHTQGNFSFRAFDITVDGAYLDFETKQSLFAKHGVAMVPVVAREPYRFQRACELAEGPTLVCDPTTAGKHSFREGIVVLAVKEQGLMLPKRSLERAQFKCISFAYLNRQGGTEYH